MDLQRNTASLRPLRGKEALDSWVREFARRDPDRARRYIDALAAFLGEAPPPGRDRPEWAKFYSAAKSPATLRAYRFAVAEFFEFLTYRKGRVVPPHEVKRSDAVEYAEWLGNRGRGDERYDFAIDAEKLKDGDLPEEKAIYEAVLRAGNPDLPEVARRLSQAVRLAHPPLEGQTTTRMVDEMWLHERLTWLVHQDLLERTPRMVTIRREDPRAGLDPEHAVDPAIYRYARPKLRPCARSTIALRLSALSSFWRVMQQGENAGERALLDYNIFEEPLARVSRGLLQEKRDASAQKRPDAELVVRVLRAAQGPRLVDRRNVALLWFLLLTGARAEEALALRRAEPPARERELYPGWLDLSTDPPTVVLLKKGGHRHRIQMPSYAMGALGAFWNELDRRGQRAKAPDDPSWRFRLLGTEPDAPLYPPLTLFGKNRVPQGRPEHGEWNYRRSMHRQALQMLLCRLSEKAGLSDAERARIHPHGFRHAAATAWEKGGLDIRQIQAILGHASVTTTEGYLGKGIDASKVSGQNAVLDWLAHAAGVEAPIAPVARPGKPTTVETRGEDATATAIAIEGRKPEVRAPSGITPPSHQLPAGPEPPPAPYVPLSPLPPEAARLVAVGPDESPGSPVAAYQALFQGKKPDDLVWSSRPQARWVEDHYPQLPVGAGVGRDSLLVWWQKDAPLPWPVMAPAQAYPELAEPGSLLAQLETLYDQWAETEPTRCLSLAKWLYYLGLVTVGIDERLNGSAQWIPYDSPGHAGADLRAHDTAWLFRWFQMNAHTFTVAARRFGKIPLPERGEPGEEYWERIREDLEVAGMQPAAAAPELPDWFFEKDPVHAIYARSPEEWKAFLRWVTRLVGLDPDEHDQRRGVHRDEQLEFFEDDKHARRDAIRAYIETFFDLIDELKTGKRDRSGAESRQLQEQVAELRRHVKRTYGVELPSEAPQEISRRRTRIDQLVDKAFPAAKPPGPTKNVLGDSRLFTPDAFRIDTTGHTLSHTPEFQTQFARDNYGQSSECVMRRVARALWEQVRGFEYEGAEASRARLTPAERQKQLFLTMLAHMAYVVPCGPDIEKMLRDAGYRVSRPTDVAKAVNEAVGRHSKTEETDGTALDHLAEDILDVYNDLAPEVEIEEAVEAAHAVKKARRPVVPEEERPARAEREAQRRRKLLENPGRPGRGRVLPHPLRMVAAAFWPV